jgi:hypothetical protein
MQPFGIVTLAGSTVTAAWILHPSIRIACFKGQGRIYRQAGMPRLQLR